MGSNASHCMASSMHSVVINIVIIAIFTYSKKIFNHLNIPHLEWWCNSFVESIMNIFIHMDSLNRLTEMRQTWQSYHICCNCSALFNTDFPHFKSHSPSSNLQFSNTTCTLVCRTSNSTVTISSCASMEPCVSDEHFQAHSHAEHTFRRMEAYLRTRKLCDVVLLAGDRRIPAHR